MSAVDANPSSNGRAPETWARPWTHLRIDRRSLTYCRVTFDHPPTNTITALTVAELAELVDLIEHDADLNVIVFDSANPQFYLTHCDADHDPYGWLDLLARLSRAPVVSIASIRGQARGAGSEFVLACDMRFASRENSAVAAGGPAARLTQLVGRGRALEILLAGDDLDGPRAEQYGYVNRAVADDQLDDEVGVIASRLARVDHDAIARTKASLDA